jgi:predicted ester cyclase
MKITLDCTPEEANEISLLLGAGKNLHELVEEAVTVKKNLEIMRRFQEEVFNAHDWSIETVSKYVGEDFIDHTYRPGDQPGREGYANRLAGWQRAFGQALQENVALIGEGDRVAVLCDQKARHTGEFMGVQPTNRDITIPGLEVFRLKDGKIVEHWSIYDFLSTAEEIGANIVLAPRLSYQVPSSTEIPGSHGVA